MTTSVRNFTALIGGAAVALSCTASALNVYNNKDVIWEAGKNQYIRFAGQDSAAFGQNSHPVDLNAEEIHKALKSLSIGENNSQATGSRRQSVFTDEQLDTLSEHLATGLSRAEPHQDIVFALVRNSKGMLGLKSGRLFVAGRFFHKDDKLNLILGDYDRSGDDGFEAAYDPTHVGIVAFQFDHDARAKPSRGLRKPVTERQGIRYKQLDESQRRDWLVLDLQEASKAADLRAKTRKEEELQMRRRELEELTESLAPAHRERPALEDAARPVQSDTPTRSIAERLIILKQLREKDLISDEEYAAKRREILDDL